MRQTSTRNLLSLDIGSQHTRAWLFEFVDGIFRFSGQSEAQTTLMEGEDLQGGVYQACERLQKLTDKRLLNHQRKLIVGHESGEFGLDQVGISLSAGPRLRSALIGLTEIGALSSLRRLASNFYTQECALISLDKGVNATQQLETLINADPDLIIIAGGFDQGASRPLLTAIEVVRLVYTLLPRQRKPQIVFLGNIAMHEDIKISLDAQENLHLASNITPTFGVEDIPAAWQAMLTAFDFLYLSRASSKLQLLPNMYR